MFRSQRLLLTQLTFSIAALVLPRPALAFEEASGVNLSLDEGFGARQQALALRFAGFGNSADVLAHGPANMNDINDLTFSTSHSERFAQAQLDHFAMLLPLDPSSTLGIGLARYGVSGIEYRPEGSEASAIPPGLFTTADYWVTTAFSRRLGDLDFGATLQILYRDLDQSGFGLRGDAMVNYSPSEHLRFQTLLVGLLPSNARWSSGYSEFESPDLHIGAAYTMPTPYLYGRWQFAWETEGLFQANGKSTRELSGSRGAFHWVDALTLSNVGMEFAFDFGLALRAGLEEIRFPSDLGNLWHAGVGYTYRGMLGLDYAFTPHPDLPNSHRIAIHWTPVFPKFSGKEYRPRPSTQAPLPGKAAAPESPGSPAPANSIVPNVSPSRSQGAPPQPAGLPQTETPEREILED
jgi:hypothetical protein